MTNNEQFIVSIMEYSFAKERAKRSSNGFWIWGACALMMLVISWFSSDNQVICAGLAIAYSLNSVFYFFNYKKYEKDMYIWNQQCLYFENKLMNGEK